MRCGDGKGTLSPCKRLNNWIDKHNRVYIIFLPVEEIEESLDVGHEKALNLLKELDDQSGIGLLHS